MTSFWAICHYCSPLSLVWQVMTLIQDIPVPVIAMVNGVATAAGCQLVASCDIAVATEKSIFATPGVNVGLFCSTPAVAIGRAVPRKVRVTSSRNVDKPLTFIDVKTLLSHLTTCDLLNCMASLAIIYIILLWLIHKLTRLPWRCCSQEAPSLPMMLCCMASLVRWCQRVDWRRRR